MIPEAKIRPALEARGIDAIVASTPMHVFYSSGLVTSTTVTPHEENFEETGYYYDTPASPPKNLAVWTAADGGPYLVIAPNESGQLHNLDAVETHVYAPDEFVLDPDGAGEEVRAAFANRHPSIYEALSAALDGLVDETSTVALETMSLSPTVAGRIESGLPTDDVAEATEVFHELRLTKTDEEIRRLEAAAEANLAAIEAAAAELEEGTTEAEFANLFRRKQTEHGATHRHTHIGFGPNSAHGHVVPGDRELQPGDLVRFEVGCYFVDDVGFEHRLDPRHTYYPGDLARTYAFREASDTHRRQYEVVYEAMKKLESLLADGADAAAVHDGAMEHARAYARDRGITEMADWTRRMSGHNVGLDCHDHPVLCPAMDEFGHSTLEAGMVLNWELGNYVQGVGGIQLEESGVLTEDGIDAWTESPETLQILD